MDQPIRPCLKCGNPIEPTRLRSKWCRACDMLPKEQRQHRAETSERLTVVEAQVATLRAQMMDLLDAVATDPAAARERLAEARRALMRSVGSRGV